MRGMILLKTPRERPSPQTTPMALHKVVPVPDNANLKRQALEVPGTKRPGQTGTRIQ